jgi:hypothetical protein
MAAVKKKIKSTTLTRSGKVRLGAIGIKGLEKMLETACPKMQDKIRNRLKLIK